MFLKALKGQSRAQPYLEAFAHNQIKTPLLLVGVSGIGKRFGVFLSIRQAFCESLSKIENCTCRSCFQIKQQAHPDISYVTSDTTIGIDAIREILEVATTYPVSAPFKVIILDGADRLTIPAANALLKLLEEPPKNVRFFLLAETSQKVLPTIVSRCGKIDFVPLKEDIVLEHFESIEKDRTKALVYCRLADGSVGTALQYWGSNRLALRDKVLHMFEQALLGEISPLFSTVDTLGDDLPLAMHFLDHLLHDLLLVSLDTSRLCNVDIPGKIRDLKRNLSDIQVANFRHALKTLQDHDARVTLQSAFHLKHLLLTVK